MNTEKIDLKIKEMQSLIRELREEKRQIGMDIAEQQKLLRMKKDPICEKIINPVTGKIKYKKTINNYTREKKLVVDCSLNLKARKKLTAMALRLGLNKPLYI